MNAHTRLSEDDHGVLTMTFTRPEKLNAISPEITASLWEAVEALATRPELRALVITGTGRFFTAGIDLNSDGRYPPAEAGGYDYRRAYRTHHRLYDEIESIEKPVIIAANGPCLGAGTELAASCDFRFCTTESYFALPEIRLGVVPGSGGCSRLTRLLGTHWTKWMALAGRSVDAERAVAIGLVHDVFPAETLLDEVIAFARSVTELSAEAVALAKLTIDLCDPHDREKTRNIERLANTDLQHRGFGRATVQKGAEHV